MKKGVQTIALFLLLLVVVLLAIFSLTAGLPAAQDDEPTSTPVGAGGQDPLAGETDEPEFGGDDPLESGPNREPDIDSPGDSGSCFAPFAPLLGLVIFGAILGRRRSSRL